MKGKPAEVIDLGRYREYRELLRILPTHEDDDEPTFQEALLDRLTRPSNRGPANQGGPAEAPLDRATFEEWLDLC